MLYDAIRRPPAGGPPRIIEAGVSLAAGTQLVNRRDADVLWPIGLSRTLSHVSRLVLLAGKRPISNDWPTATLTARQVEVHVLKGGNVGMRCGAGLIVLDFDNPEAEREMMEALGPLPLTVVTGSGKHHYYATGDENYPAKLRWKDQTVGEIQRTHSQQVVCPPSIHPDTQAPYRWATEATPLFALPEKWLAHIRRQDTRRSSVVIGAAITEEERGAVPKYIKIGDARGHEADGEEWTGPDAEEILRRASLQPGAKQRRNGVKFQCPGCAATGRDKHRDNAIVGLDGRWGCCIDQRHKKAIGAALGIGPRMMDHPDGVMLPDPTHDHPLVNPDPDEYPLVDSVEYPMWVPE